MSRQLTRSAIVAVFSMAAFAVMAGGNGVFVGGAESIVGKPPLVSTFVHR